MGRISVQISISLDKVLDKMARRAEYEADRQSADDTEVWQNARVKEADGCLMEDYWREACGNLNNRLWKYIVGDFFEEKEEGQTYVMQLELPQTWRRSAIGDLEELAENYCMAWMLNEWLSLGTDGASRLTGQANAALAAVSSLCNKRERPQLWPEASAVVENGV